MVGGFGLLVLLLQGVLAATALGTTKITYADTILAKVISEIYNYPIILLDKNNITNETLNELKELNVTELIIIGGPAVVSQKVENELKNLGINVTRIWGVTRYETSALVARFFWDNSSKAIILTRDLVNERAGIREIELVREAIEKAIDERIPILITPTGNLEENVAKTLIDLNVTKVYIFTKSRNLGNLTKELENLGISYEVYTFERPVKLKCTKIIRIAVPNNVNWTFARELLIGKRCVKIQPVFPNVTLSELQGKFDYVILSNSALKRFKKEVIEEFRERARKIREEPIKIFEEKVKDLMEELADEMENLMEEYQKTGNKLYLKMINEINNTLESMDKLLKEGRSFEAFRLGMKTLRDVKMFKWKHKLYEKEIRSKIEKEILKAIKARIKVISKLYNLSKEDVKNLTKVLRKREKIRELIKEIREKMKEMVKEKIKKELLEHNLTKREIKEILKELKLRWIPDPWKLKKELLEKMRKRGFCIQIIVWACDPITGECKQFPTPCDVPKGWKIFPEKINKNRTIVRKNKSTIIKVKPILIQGSSS